MECQKCSGRRDRRHEPLVDRAERRLPAGVLGVEQRIGGRGPAGGQLADPERHRVGVPVRQAVLRLEEGDDLRVAIDAVVAVRDKVIAAYEETR